MKVTATRRLPTILSCAAILAVGTSVAPSALASDFTTAGTECVSNNLQQALNSPIIWDNWRVRNANPTADRFVLCPVAHYTDIDDGVADLINSGDIYLTGWFGPGAATNAEITCTVRAVPTNDAGAPTSGASTLVTLSAGGSVPDTDQVITDLDGLGFSVGVPIVAACRLPPDTGIQQIGVGIQ